MDRLVPQKKSKTVLKILRDFEGQLEPWNRANAAEIRIH